MRFNPIVLAILVGTFFSGVASADSKWSLKSLIPTSKESSTIQKKKPSVIKRVSASSKSLMTKTKNLVVPKWGPKKRKAKNSMIKRSWNKVKTDAGRVKKAMVSPLKKLVTPKEPEQPKTVNEFLALPRPEFGRR